MSTSPRDPRRHDQIRRRLRRLRYPAAAIGVAALAAALWAVNRGAAAPADERIPVKTVAIVRTDLSTSHTLRGSLGFGTAQPVKGSREGVVTWLPAPGSSIARGELLYRVNDEPVALFYGSVPLYRPLSERNTVGRDVAVVAENLKALGYAIGAQPKVGEVVTQSGVAATPPPGGTAGAGASTGPPVRVTVRAGDAVLNAGLIAAVKKWQRDHNVTQDGRVDVGDVAVLPGAVRVDSVAGQIGDSAVGALMSVTPTTKVVTVQAATTEVDSIRQGDATTVRLPDGTEAPGKVVAIGTAATPEGGAGQQPKVNVTITLDDPKVVDRLTAADVQVDVAGETHRRVLAVQVGALLALSEGGYAVQLEDGSLVAVRTGLFAKGMVEITGAGLDAGVKVVTTS